jgi:Na+-transporting NADH:ubiquinone oxidoreductase subunit NqrB
VGFKEFGNEDQTEMTQDRVQWQTAFFARSAVSLGSKTREAVLLGALCDFLLTAILFCHVLGMT